MGKKTEEYQLTGNLILLSDLFRRSAQFDQQEPARELVNLTREFGCDLTWIYGEYPMSHGMNRAALEDISKTMTKMADVAASAGLKSLRLPLHKDDPHAGYIKDHVVSKNRFPVRFLFCTANYRDDLDSVGSIKPEIKTFLDEGIRGLGAIEPSVKYKWDRDIAKGGQFSLEL